MPDTAAIVLSRFGMGARPGERTKLITNPAQWAQDQLQVNTGIDPVFAALPSTQTAASTFSEFRDLRKKGTKAGQENLSDEAKEIRKTLRDIGLAEIDARMTVGLTTQTPFAERLVRFWSNHFAVSSKRQKIAPMVGAFEREAIRPNLSGSFLDLLIAAEQHPAMIMFLDNELSVGPNSKVGLRRDRGLNENLAREILELHTLGVNGGYSQEDVTSFARILTGWTVADGKRIEGPLGSFQFFPKIHEPGTHQVLGKSYAEGGITQGLSVLNDLANHPATAHFIASKLVKHFISDVPKQSDVDRITDVFQETEGHLPSIHAALLTLPSGFTAPLQKARSPEAYITATLRGINHIPPKRGPLQQAMKMMGYKPFAPDGPDGFPDTSGEWLSGAALLRRIEWADTLGDKFGSTVDARSLMADLYGGLLSDETETAIRRAESGAQGLAIALASPEMIFT
ncbi:hypothetical protein GCM10017044_20510 [Kordiimonas sediminis]|uniref:DUF1800 domain-containing protein n=1 Tax=Kordiimonas sediminis TaxID=1735581 RepID=A0A919E8W5_9PROT|nr:DUF1800 family protein [Kordiimonas sediminis]GHF25594.1 hypothetical protein GCM10017044_20510 [Kordiimonas sediminis]